MQAVTKYKTLLEVFQFASGKSIKKSINGKYPIFGSNGIIGYSDLFNENDALLIGRVGASGSIHILDQNAWITDNVLIAKPKIPAEKQFLYYSLINMNLLKYATKSAQPLLTQQILNPLKLWFPSIQEQQKIADILSKVDKLIQKTDQVIRQTRTLKKGLMQRLFTKGIGQTKFKKTEFGEIPEGWGLVKFGDIIEDIRYGTSIKCSIESKGIPILRIPNIVNGLNFDNLKYALLSKEELERFQIFEGDILFVRTNGNKQYVGRTIVFPKINEPYAFASYLIKVKLKSGNIYPYFFNYQLALSKLKNQILNSIKTSAGQYNLNTEGIKSLKIVLPPADEQYKILLILSNADAWLKQQSNKKSQLDNLKRGLMRQLLTGKLRVNI